MADSIITVKEALQSQGFWALDQKDTISIGDSDLDQLEIPFINDPEAWRQYHSEITYQADKLTREWIESMSGSSAWKSSAKRRRYTFSMLFELVFKRPYDQKTDGGHTKEIAAVFGHYCSKIQKGGFIDGKAKSKSIYTISYSRYKKVRPFSLKLNLELLREQGIEPDNWNMKMPDTLKPGHARNPRTDANMEARREDGRRRYNEYQRERRARIKEGV